MKKPLSTGKTVCLILFALRICKETNMIRRDLYLNRLIDYKDKDIIKIITGVRRCGKSYLLFEIFSKYLHDAGVDDRHVIALNLESGKCKSLRSNDELYKHIGNLIKDKEKHYVFIDEIQLVSGFEEVVNSLKADFNCDLYITGSNSRFLSSDINTRLRGRGVEIRVHPLSFKEYYDYMGGEVRVAFSDYVRYGGMPYVCELDKDYEKVEYLKMLNDTVASRDVIERNNIRNEGVFDALLQLLSSQIGSYVSPNKISSTFKSNGFKKTDNETISAYLSFICDGFLFYKAQRFDIKGKEYLKTQNKYYCCDLGLRNQRLNFRQMELTHILENLVYLELLRRGFSVDIGKNQDKEIDFIARSHQDLIYIQVSFSIEEPSVRQRELSAFRGIDDGYRKIIITADANPLTILEKGYRMMNVYDFLLDENSL